MGYLSPPPMTLRAVLPALPPHHRPHSLESLCIIIEVFEQVEVNSTEAMLLEPQLC